MPLQSRGPLRRSLEVNDLRLTDRALWLLRKLRRESSRRSELARPRRRLGVRRNELSPPPWKPAPPGVHRYHGAIEHEWIDSWPDARLHRLDVMLTKYYQEFAHETGLTMLEVIEEGDLFVPPGQKLLTAKLFDRSQRTCVFREWFADEFLARHAAHDAWRRVVEHHRSNPGGPFDSLLVLERVRCAFAPFRYYPKDLADARDQRARVHGAMLAGRIDAVPWYAIVFAHNG